ncbi:MAG: Ig-like domain-containing protein [Gemmatimonadota bacterium]
MLTRLVVELPSMTLVVGATVVASASGLDQGGKPIAISSPAWSTGTPNVATISADGVVTAHASGQTQVVATVGGTEGRATLTVLDVQVSAVSVAPAVTTLLAGATRQLAVTVLDDDGRVVSGRPIAWSSSDSAKVTVSAAGVITGVATGTATITASVGGKSAAATVSVAAPGELATIEISARTPNLVVGDTLQLTATLRDAEGTVLAGREVTWVTSVAAGSGVASLSGAGLLTAESVGTVVVEAVSGGQRGALAITVRARVDESIVVTFANPLPNELIGDTLRVVAGVRSDRPLQRVVAVIEGKEYPLVLTPTNRSGVLWMGWIDVTFQKYGPYTLTVVATDETEAIGLAALTYQRDTRIGEVGGKLPPKNK